TATGSWAGPAATGACEPLDENGLENELRLCWTPAQADKSGAPSTRPSAARLVVRRGGGVDESGLGLDGPTRISLLDQSKLARTASSKKIRRAGFRHIVGEWLTKSKGLWLRRDGRSLQTIASSPHCDGAVFRPNRKWRRGYLALKVGIMRAKTAPINTEGAGEPSGPSFVLGGHFFAAPKAAAGLYLVATPIGNLGDITLRALETLAGGGLIACEDTRITRPLTQPYGIAAELAPYHEHNAASARPKILRRLADGASVALVSDAGTPLISDPGFKLVREACTAGHSVVALPGPSSVLAALSVAGLPTDRFFFE